MHWNTITARIRGNVAIVELSGMMCLCESDDKVPAFIVELLEQGFLKFLLDLRRVPHIDGEGLGDVVRAYVKVNQKGGRLKLFHVAKPIRDLLDLLKRTNFSLVSHPSATGPRGHETGYSVRRRWRRGRLVIGAWSPFPSWTRSPASTPYCVPGPAGERTP
jgi:anti-anti-sigma factor